MIGYLIEHWTPGDSAGLFHMVKTYKLGLVDEPLPGDEQFAGSLAIPYLTPTGPRSIKFRNLGEGPKILQASGQEARMYNTQAYLDASDFVGLAEGEIDAIVATEKLGVPTLGLPGADSWRPKARIWASLFKDFRTVYVFADGDDAGKKLTAAISDSLKWRVHLVRCPNGEDVSSMVAAGRANELNAIIRPSSKDEE